MSKYINIREDVLCIYLGEQNCYRENSKCKGSRQCSRDSVQARRLEENER